ncbi:MAG: hypothetical protein WC495_03915 [Patescibacteria group bacterium]|jgi:hypothetical protein
MSTSDFKNYFIIGLVLVLLFGVGVGYQLGITLASDDSTKTTNTDNMPNNAVISDETPVAQPEIYVRTGQVESINPTQIEFSTYVQNSDSNYSQVIMTAQINDQTAFTKINLRDSNSSAQTIVMTDIPVGSEVAVASTDNIYGKTAFTAESIQLHQE